MWVVVVVVFAVVVMVVVVVVVVVVVGIAVGAVVFTCRMKNPITRNMFIGAVTLPLIKKIPHKNAMIELNQNSSYLWTNRAYPGPIGRWYKQVRSPHTRRLIGRTLESWGDEKINQNSSYPWTNRA